MKESSLSKARLVGYSVGIAGWSILLNTVGVMLIYFYLPPENSGLTVLVPQISVLGILTLFSVVLASGRLFDAFTDPLIAWFSDRFSSRWGRRIPFIFISIIPSAFFCTFLFFPNNNFETARNYVWLFFGQFGFYFFLTMYIIPYNALMPELAKTSDEKLNISVLLSFGFVIGIIIAAQIPFLAKIAGESFPWINKQDQFRIAIIVVIVIASILMFIPVLVINEKKHCNPQPTNINIFKSVKAALSNKQFLVFMIADSSFFITLAIITSGLLYYVKVLMNLPEQTGAFFLGIMVVTSILFYPLVIFFVKKIGIKKLIIFSFLVFAFLFLCIFYMGKINIQPKVYLYSLAFIVSFPVAVLGILPYAIIAEIAENIYKEKLLKIEGMFFAVRTFGDKLGQTIGVMIFAVLTLFGRDQGNDLGIRLSALVGMLICIAAAIIFLAYNEKKRQL